MSAITSCQENVNQSQSEIPLHFYIALCLPPELNPSLLVRP